MPTGTPTCRQPSGRHGLKFRSAATQSRADPAPPQHRRHDQLREPRAIVWRRGMHDTGGRVDGHLRSGFEQHEVGIVAGLSRPCAVEPGAPAGAATPLREALKIGMRRAARPGGCGADDRRESAATHPAQPRRFAVSMCFMAAGAGEWSVVTSPMCPSERAPQPSRAALANRRPHLSRYRVRHVSAGKVDSAGSFRR